MANFGRMALALAATVVLASCSGGEKSSMSAGGGEAAAAKPAAATYYAEESVKGRTYVFATDKSFQRYKSTGEVPGVAVTFISAGSNGETVVLEADGKDPSVQERAKTEYNRRHTPKLP